VAETTGKVWIIRFKNEGDGLGVPLFISTDQEGGTVQRFANFGMPSAQQVAEKMTTAQAESMVRGRALELKSSGIDMDLAPLADVAQSEPNTNFLGTRIFSNNPTIVTAYDKAYVEGLEAGGILPTLKHFPDLGSANGDTDVQSAETLPIASMVQHDDLVPYATLASSGTAIMVGNAIVPGLTNGLPASLSPNAYSYLRTTLGDKNNLLITDALNATAITGITTEAHAVVDAISAGDDIALVVEDDTTIGGVELLMGQLEGAIVAAIKSGLLPEQRLAEAVTAKLAAQSINACTVLANIGT
jgi:beta-N-acetylhexosaminidase